MIGYAPCKICSAESVLHGHAVVRRKYRATWLRCESCGFVFAENPIWLEEAYAEPINASDCGYVERNMWCCEKVRYFIEAFLQPDGKFLDFAAGYGLFVRLMRDAGYDFLWQDNYCENLFARGFEAKTPLTGPFEVVTAFEVFEHLSNPLPEIGQIAALAPCLLFSTALMPDSAPPLLDWPYYGLEHGQHISFFSRKSLTTLAARLDRFFSTDGTFHVLSQRHIDERHLRRMNNRWWKFYMKRRRLRSSLTESDHDEIVRRLSNGQLPTPARGKV